MRAGDIAYTGRVHWSELPLKPSARTLRQFAALSVVVFAALAAWQGVARQHWTAAFVLISLCLTIGPLGLWRPHLVRPIYVGWMIAAFPLGWIVSLTLLALVYYLVVTPLGVASRLVGRDRLGLRPDAEQKSYWSSLEAAKDPRRYFRQY